MDILKPGPALPRMTFKPAGEQMILYSVETYNGTLEFRFLRSAEDLDIVYEWVNRQYSHRFWQMNGSRHLLEVTYNYYGYTLSAFQQIRILSTMFGLHLACPAPSHKFKVLPAL